MCRALHRQRVHGDSAGRVCFTVCIVFPVLEDGRLYYKEIKKYKKLSGNVFFAINKNAFPTDIQIKVYHRYAHHMGND